MPAGLGFIVQAIFGMMGSQSLLHVGALSVRFTEKLRLFTHIVGNLSRKGIARRALPASGGKDVVGGNKKCK